MISLPQYSPDRRYWWNGTRWLPVARPGLLWFTKTPEWLVPVILMSLLGLIPALGFLCLFGWLLAARDNLRAGVLRVPPASWSHWRRGIYFFFTFLFYTLALILIAFILLALDAFLLKSGHGQIGVDVVILFIILLLFTLAGFFLYTFGAILTIADARGIVSTFNLALVWRTATYSSGASWRFLGAYLLGGLGLAAIATFIPLVGVLAAWLLASAVYLMTAPALAEITIPPTA